MSRIGNNVQSIGLSQAHYGVSLGDNSIRVFRSDNNKTVISHCNASFENDSLGCDLSSSSNLLIVPNKDNLQFVDFS